MAKKWRLTITKSGAKRPYMTKIYNTFNEASEEGKYQMEKIYEGSDSKEAYLMTCEQIEVNEQEQER